MAARVLRALAAGALGIALLVVAIPLVTGHPILSYPVSESMEPTLGPFDVFVVDPFPGAIGVGDIIVFQSVVRGGPAVHRVVAIDEHGFTTKGDANPDVDQIGGEPPVTRDRLLGRVLTTPSGAPLAARNVGAVATEIDAQHARLAQAVGGNARLAALTLLALAAAFAAPAIARGRRRRRAPPPSPRTRAFLARRFPRGVRGKHVGLALLVLLAASTLLAERNAVTTVDASMVVVSDASAADATRATTPGGTLPRDVAVDGQPFLPILAIAEPASAHVASDGNASHARIAPGSTAVLRVRETAGDAPGYQQDKIHVWRYPALLPDSWTLALHRAAPGAPIVALAAGAALVGSAWFAALGVARRPVGRWLGLKEEWL